MAEVVKWLIVAFLSYGALSTVASVGKPRKPLEPAVAVLTVVFTGAIVAGILIYWES